MKIIYNPYLFFVLLGLQACKKKSDDNPQPASETNNSTATIVDCNNSLFRLPLVAYHVGDTIRSINGILHMHCQNKNSAITNACILSTNDQVLKGDFSLKMSINHLSLSSSFSPEPGSFRVSLLNITGNNIVRRLYSIVSQQGLYWTSYPDTLASKKVTLPMPSAFNYQISRVGTNLRAVLYFQNDSVVAQNTTFGSEDLSLGLSIGSDTSGKESSSVRIVDFQLKQGLVATVKESFGCNKYFTPK